MEANYGVGVTNRFFLCDEYDDPSDIVAQGPKEVSHEEKENKAVPKSAGEKKKPTAKKATKPVKTTEAPAKAAQQGKANNQRNGDARVKLSDNEERNNRRNKPEGQRFDNNRRNDGERPQRRTDRPPRRFDGEQGEGNSERPPRRFDGPRRFEGEGGERRYNNEGGERRFNNDERRTEGEGGFRGRGRGMGRGGRGRGMGERGGRREFDRQSGSGRSGVRPTDKREGSGAYNWGSNKEVINDEEAAAEDKKTDVVDAEGQSGNEGEDSANETKEPEEPEEMTLAEYKAAMKAKRSAPEVNLRKAGEGENTDQWKSTFVLKKKDDVKEKKVRGEKAAEDSEEEKEVVKSGRTKFVLDCDFKFADSPSSMRGGRGRGGRGSRGMGMGGRGMGAGRGGRGGLERAQQAPKMDDAALFPSLK